MLTFKLVLVAAATSVLGIALPEPTAAAQLDLRGVNCKKVNAAFDVLKKLGPPATSFCRDYLHMPATSTAVTITTPATVTSTTSTTTVTVTTSDCPGQKRAVPVLNQKYKIESSDEASWVVRVQKRTNVLPQLRFFAEAKISDACGCLCMKPTATTTVVSTAPAPTTYVVATTTACVVPQPVCKNSGWDEANKCASGADCCSGLCGTSFGTSTCCNASNKYCDLSRPDACCSGTCFAGNEETGSYCG